MSGGTFTKDRSAQRGPQLCGHLSVRQRGGTREVIPGPAVRTIARKRMPLCERAFATADIASRPLMRILASVAAIAVPHSYTAIVVHNGAQASRP